jgi:hypothetical protein
MSKSLIAVILSLLSFTSFTARVAQASDYASDLTLLAGTGLTDSDLLHTASANGNPHQFSNNGFIMGFEYAHDFGSSPIYWSGTFVTSDIFLLGTGIDLGFVRLGAKYGYGLSQRGDNSPTTNLDSTSYGWLAGASVELKLSSTFGISADYITNKSYLGGISMHF